MMKDRFNNKIFEIKEHIQKLKAMQQDRQKLFDNALEMIDDEQVKKQLTELMTLAKTGKIDVSVISERVSEILDGLDNRHI